MPTLTRRRPSELSPFWREFEDLWRNFERFFGRPFASPLFPRFFPEGRVEPGIDLYGTDQEIILRAYLPDVRKEDIHLQVTEDRVYLKGERKAPEGEVTWYIQESVFGPFETTIQLPEPVEAEKARATFKEGILEVHLPKAKGAKTVEVKVED